VTERRLRLLLISPTDYQSAVKKGVAPLLADFDEGGFFDRVRIAFPLARTSCAVAVSDRVLVEDIGTDWLPFGGRFRWIRRVAAPVHFLRVFRTLIGHVRRDRIDVIRATDPCFSGTFAWVTATLTGRPFCVSIHADFDKRYELGGASTGTTILGSRALARAVERFVLRRAAMVMPIRDSLREYAITSGAQPDRIAVIPHGTDLSTFVQPSAIDVAALFELPAGRQIVSFVGRLAQENYLDDILEAARQLSAERSDFALLILGGGPEEERLHATVRADPALRDIVYFAGFRSRDVVAAVRQASAASLCLMGGFSLIEACAAASPVIAYDVEWHGELVRNGETGFLVDEHDVRQLASTIGRLLNDRSHGAVLGKAARALALQRHDLELTRETKRRCYLALVGDNHNAVHT
jgi:glycosyltransferase involved in cell wall biosynthesis